MAGAAGSFVTRSFELMLKEATAKKSTNLQKALKAYLDSSKDISQESLKQKDHLVTKPEIDDNSGKDLSSENSVKEPGQEELDSKPSSSTLSAANEEGNDYQVSSTNEALTTTLATAGHTLQGAELELVLQPLRLALETKNPKLVEPALDCLHKLIAYEHLEGEVGIEDGKNSIVFTEIVNLICGSLENLVPDSTVLQVLKVLLTAVASTKFRVHGESLLSVIRTCYSIALNSKSTINQATAKGTLTQMISIVFKRMETEDQDVIVKPRAVKQESQEIVEDSSSQKSNEEVNLPSENDSSEKKIEDATLLSVKELQHLAGGADIKGLEAVLDKAVQSEENQKTGGGINFENMSIWQHDALLVFRTLCKTAMKEEKDEFLMRTKILSLELLQGLLEGVSPSFTVNFQFIDSVKTYLSYALLRACVSSSLQILQLSTSIFAILLVRFRESLKAEIGVFFPLIILKSLDSTDSSVNQRTCVLRMLEKVCKDSQMLADVFVNYDCDLEATNLFERMVNVLSRIAQGTLITDPSSVTLAQNASIKSSSLQCLVNVLNSLVKWTNAHDTAKKIVASTIHTQDGQSSEGSSLHDGSKLKEEVPSKFEKAKAQKSTMETAVAEFNRKPDKGIEYLVSNMMLEKTPSSVAQFLRTTLGLDKAMIGDYLGQHEEFPVAVMHAYVDAMNFKGLKFDKAIREFLKGFRLPGEAQKIDRIMEKFAERYCQDNPGLFKNADTAYVLAYAVIMLNTDAHNPTVWPKMSKSDFVRMNMTTDAEECPPKELLEEIYDSVVNEEITMKNDEMDPGRSRQRPDTEERGRVISILNLAMPRRKVQDDTKRESEEIVKRTQAFFKKSGGKRGVFYTAHQMELVRPMLEAVGWPLLAAFSVTMEDSDNKPQVVLCMEGFRLGIHLTRVLGMDTMRYAFLTSLIRFTYLHAPKELRSKNVEALKSLLVLCDTEPDALQDTWNAVLECVSRLEYITSTPSISLTVNQGSNQISRDALISSLKELTSKPSEQVFLNSVKLPSDTIVEFFTALCGVSAEELKQTPARVFSLQKLVEISYYNMARIRMVWARIWSVLSHHFITAGSHHDENIAMYAIDSLRQLGMKYLEREELAKFTFQNDILKPFVVLMRNSRSRTIRNLIVDCIVQMIKSKVGSIKSGWRSVFMIFTAAADDENESIAESAFENVEQVVLEHFDQVVGDCFMDCVNCLIGFANNKSCPRISLKAIALLRICEDRLAEGLIPGGALKPVEAVGMGSEFDVTEHYWFPMLAGLSELTSDPRTEVRNCALEVLFDLLKERGHKFSAAFWENVFLRVLFPIFDHVRHRGKDGSIPAAEDPWLRDTCIHSLQLLCDLFSSFYKDVSFMLPSLLGLLLDCAKRPDQTVASISCNALVHLIKVGGHQFNDKDWDTLLISIRDVSYTTQPVELLHTQGLDGIRKSTSFQVTNEDHTHGREVHDDVVVEEVHENGNSISGLGQAHVNSEVERPMGQPNLQDADQDENKRHNAEEFEDVSSTSVDTKQAVGNVSKNQSFGQKFMGNMMDTLLLKNLTFKSKGRSEEAPRSPASVIDVSEESHTAPVESEEGPSMKFIRGKCFTQLLLLNAIDCIQNNHWKNLNASHKLIIMDILLALVDFASSYNSYSNLRLRMQQMPIDRYPVNILRHEIEATRIYLEVLQKGTTSPHVQENPQNLNYSANVCAEANGADLKEKQRVQDLAEQKLVLFCGQVLREAADLQPCPGEAVDADVYRALVLRSPVIVKVVNGMSIMDKELFKKNLSEFFPSVTKLVCSDQMDVRRALGDLFKRQVQGLLP